MTWMMIIMTQVFQANNNKGQKLVLGEVALLILCGMIDLLLLKNVSFFSHCQVNFELRFE